MKIFILSFFTLLISKTCFSQVILGKDLSEDKYKVIQEAVSAWTDDIINNFTPNYNTYPDIVIERVNAKYNYNTQDDNSEIYFKVYWNGKKNSFSSIKSYAFGGTYISRTGKGYVLPPIIRITSVSNNLVNDYDWLTFENIMQGLDIAIKVKELFNK